MRRREFLQTTGIGAGCAVLQGPQAALAQGNAFQHTGARPACCCGTLGGSPALPNLRDLPGAEDALILHSMFAGLGPFCFFCGGHPQGPWQKNPVRCACGWLAIRAAEPSSAIQWDREILECYTLTTGRDRQTHWPIYFCPNCGGLAPGALV